MENVNKAYKPTIFVTTNYESLKPLLGNRDVTERRVNNIMESINRIGYISQPIIVNEKREIIDGQGRLEALKRLGMPVEYRIIPGLTVKQCQALNLRGGGWSVGDFVKSYADVGDRNYVNLVQLQKKYGLTYPTLLCIILNNRTINSFSKRLREGNVSITPEQFAKACDFLEWGKELEEFQKKIGGRQYIFWGALSWVYEQPGVNRDRLKNTIMRCWMTFAPPTKAKQFFDDLSREYNKGIPKSKRRNFTFERETREGGRASE